MREAYRPMKLQAENDNAPNNYAEADIARLERQKGLAVAEELLRWYPGHPWHVQVKLWANEDRTIPGGVAISLPVLMPPNKYYTIPLVRMTDANSFVRHIRRAGGEILERYRIPRAGCNFDHLLNARPKRVLSYKDRVPA